MSRLLTWEFRKLTRQKSLYICTAIMIALLFLSAITSKALSNANIEIAVQYSSGITAAVQAISNGSFLLIAGIFTALFVCDDYEQQTIKTMYSKGYSRLNVYFLKYIAVLLSITLMFVLVIFSAFLFGSLYFGVGETGIYTALETIAVQYILCVANISFYFAISSVLRKNGSSIAAVIVAQMLVNMILGLADSFLKSDKIVLTKMWLSSFANDLSVLTVDHNRLMVCLIASLAYIPLFVMIGALFQKKIEI